MENCRSIEPFQKLDESESTACSNWRDFMERNLETLYGAVRYDQK